jgi:hypothetical protein
MALEKQSVVINFSMGLNSKTDENQLPIGQFVYLQNAVFSGTNTKVARLQKRNGFGTLTTLPDSTNQYLTTFNGNLVALGSNLFAYSRGSDQWINKGAMKPVQFSVMPVVRSSSNQIQVDTATAPNGLMCVVFTDSVTVGSTAQSFYKYMVQDSNSGQVISGPSNISATFGTNQYAPKVFSLKNYFVLVFDGTLSSNSQLQYQTISSYNPTVAGSVTSFATNYSPNSQCGFDGVVANNTLFLSWNSSGAQGIKSGFLNSSLQASSQITIASQSAAIVSVTADTTQPSPVVYTSFYTTGSNSISIVAESTTSGSGSSQSLATLFSARALALGANLINVASAAKNGQVNVFYQINSAYSYDGTIRSDYIQSISCSQTGSLGPATNIVRSVGLASKAFAINSTSYFFSVYQSPYQSTYFLMNESGQALAKYAYGNAYGYYTTGIPSVNIIGSQTAYVGYLLKTTIQSVSKETNVSSSTQVAGIYSQTGINLAKFQFNVGNSLVSAETGGNLHVNGGFLWSYDGSLPTEQSFHLYPDSLKVNTSAGSGSLTSQTYYYRATYEWTDNQGNLFRSAPSLPVQITSSSTASANGISIPTLRVTNKIQNPPNIVLYRWSTNQQTYYRVTSITAPVTNSTTSDSVFVFDSNTDQAILGNNILYTTGGVVENTGGPGASALTLFDNRLWAITSEDSNQLYESKEIIQATPVEMSQLLTTYIPPSAAAQGASGPVTCVFPMDDKLISFKKNAIYYINGVGPDNTGANNQYSQPILVSGTVGCNNQASIVLTDVGLMFQSDKGIWLLSRNLQLQYIGAPVEAYNEFSVKSALVIPGTTQVRFTLSNNQTLMYDYFTNQWGVFASGPGTGISSTLYNGHHTFLNSKGQIFTETPGQYLDGSSPVLLSFKTGWINLVDAIQGYVRLYEMYFLGTFKTPHKLVVSLAQDYDPAIVQRAVYTPDNFSGFWGGEALWGSGSVWGGSNNVEQLQFNIKNQQCQAIQISMQEIYDPSEGVVAGAGLTLSGIKLMFGAKGRVPQNIPTRNRIG